MRVVCQGEGTDEFPVQTDADGWCGPGRLDESDVVVFGDSFAFGYAVRRPFFRVSPSGLRVKAVAAPGYNMVQELLLMSELGPQLRRKLVVWFLYPGNDFTDNLCPGMQGYRTPFVRESADRTTWEIVSSHLASKPWAAQPRYDRARKVSMVFGRNPSSERVYSACQYLIARGAAVCREARATLVVLVIPWMIQFDRLPWPGIDDDTVEADLPDRRIGRICEDLGVPCVRASQHLGKQHYFADEGHLNEEGHARLAELLDALHARQRASTPDAVWPGVAVLEKA
jgi:hypothetical protein